MKMKSCQQYQNQIMNPSSKRNSNNNSNTNNSRCYFSLACTIGSMSIACGSLLQLNSTSDRISLQRGLFLTSMGFVYFISLTDFFNKYFLETKHGIRFRKKYHLMISDVMDITNKIVSAIQAAFSCLAGFIACKSSCSKSLLHASHFIMEAYAWFGTAYFMYDIWSMYKVHIQKISDKLKLMNNITKSTLSMNKPTMINGKFLNEQQKSTENNENQIINNEIEESEEIISNPKKIHEVDNDDEDYEDVIEIPKDGQCNFFKYIITHPIMTIHHVFIGTFGLVVLTYLRGNFGDCVYSFIYMMEFSTPFVSLRSILSTLQLKNTRLYIVNGLTMLGSFFICRILMWPYVFYIYSVAINRPFIQAIMGLPRGCKISILILLIPQLYWFSLMTKGAIKVFFTSKKLDKKEDKTKILPNEKNINYESINSQLRLNGGQQPTSITNHNNPTYHQSFSPIITNDQNKKLIKDMRSPTQSRTLL